IGDAYFDAAETANFRDMDVLMLGPVVKQAENVFDEYWNSSVVLPIRSLAGTREGDLPRIKARLEALASRDSAQPYLQRLRDEKSIESVLDGEPSTHWTATARVVSDPAEKANGSGQEKWLSNIIFSEIRSATSKAHIISPYFIPGDRGVAALR